MATLHSSSPGPAVRPNFPPSNFTLFQRIFGAISVNTHGELLKLMQMKLKSVKNTTQMTLQSYVAKAYMLSYIQQKSVEFYYVLQATSKTAPTDLNRKNVFFQKWNGGFIQLGKMVSIDKMSASNSKFENLRWTPQLQLEPYISWYTSASNYLFEDKITSSNTISSSSSTSLSTQSLSRMFEMITIITMIVQMR